MTFIGFTGPAGTGKTHALLTALDEQLDQHPLTPSQRVLALTFMHGSRRRLNERLASSSARGRYECQTFDRFAWEIVRRWRSRLGAVPDSAGRSAYDVTCEAAGQLLAAREVAGWVARSFPVVVVDEFQDCSDERLAIVRALAPRVRLLVGADAFQDLRSTGPNAAVEWLTSQEGVTNLSRVWRTDRPGLLKAALALRDGRPPSDGDGFTIRAVPAYGLAASSIAFAILNEQARDLAILSTTHPGKSPFVDDVITALTSKGYGKQGKVGPFPVRWEDTTEAIEREAAQALGVSETDDAASVSAGALLAAPRSKLTSAIVRWVDHQRRVCGRTSFKHMEIRAQVKQAAQQRRGYQQESRGRRAMVIQQAKNREFDHVVVLWPFQVTSGAEAGRRLLYNAVTRARKSALVIVQDPKRDRMQKAPFA